jgi:uncharacterized membrane protein YhhN
MFTWLFWLMLVVAVVDWVGSWRGWHAIRWVTKPGTLILLIAWFTQVGGWRGELLWFGLGLVFSLLGDIFLHMPARFFMPGVGAFLMAHVFYIIGFWQEPFRYTWQLIIPVILVGAAFWLLNRRIRAGLRAHNEMSMLVPVMVYAGVLSLMWLTAMTTIARPAWTGIPAALASVGAGLFFLSDSLLAYNRFVRPLPESDLMVMISYHIGQILIAASALALVV